MSRALLLLGCLLSSCATFAQAMDVPVPHDHGTASLDAGTDASVDTRVGVHGMLLTGAGNQLYLSHLPAFYEPHRVQIVVEAEWVSRPANVPADLAGELYSLRPDAFSLDALRAGVLTSLRGDIFRGNHEQGGTLLGSQAQLHIVRLLYQQELTGNPLPTQGYLVFGNSTRSFAIHQIGAEPGYDHLVRITASRPLPAGATLLQRTMADPVEQRLMQDTTFIDTAGTPWLLHVEQSLSCLLGPGFAAPCSP